MLTALDAVAGGGIAAAVPTWRLWLGFAGNFVDDDVDDDDDDDDGVDHAGGDGICGTDGVAFQ